MSIYATRKDSPYIVEETMAQLLLESKADPEKQEVITECARLFETNNLKIMTAKEPEKDDKI